MSSMVGAAINGQAVKICGVCDNWNPVEPLSPVPTRGVRLQQSDGTRKNVVERAVRSARRDFSDDLARDQGILVK
jgi:hypothetical protein